MLNENSQAQFKKSQVNANLLIRRANAVYSWGKDYHLAFTLYNEAAEAGDPRGMQGLANCYFQGHGADANVQKGLFWLQKAAELGLATAQFELGRRFFGGYDVPQDNAAAFSWFLLAARQNEPNALYLVGLCYFTGRCVARDYREAFRYVSLAEERRNSPSLYLLALAYQKVLGTEVHKLKALQYMNKAARWGLPNAAFQLGVWYYEGICGAPDKDAARYWLDIAIADGSVEAQDFIQNHSDLQNIYKEK